VAKKNVETQTEVQKQDASAQVSGCRECQSLTFAVLGEGDSTCVRCDQLNDLLSQVADLMQEGERLRSIKECEREIDSWYQTLPAPRSWQPDEAVSHPLLSCKQVTEGNHRIAKVGKDSQDHPVQPFALHQWFSLNHVTQHNI